MIKPGSIRESHLSQQFELKHNKLQKADEGSQLLIAENNPDAANHLNFKPITIHGDGTLDGSGKLTVNFPETSTTVVSGDGLTDEQKQKLDSIEEGATRDKTRSEIKVAYEENPDTNAFSDTNKSSLEAATDANTASAIVKRDSSGNIIVGTVTGNLTGTASAATNATNLNGQNASYYLDSDNTAPGDVSNTNAGNGLTFTTQTIPFKQIVATYDYDAQGTGTGASSTTITHNFGYIPSARIYKISGSDLIEIEMYVTSTTTATTVHFDYINFDIRIILR